MKAAVLHTLGNPPRYEDFPDPQPGQNEVIVHIKAASLKNIDKAMASGSHYDSHRELPVVCGVDGVGVLDDGTRVFCGGSRPPYGVMAEQTVVSRAWCLPVPGGVDDNTAAALPNPALSSWLPLVWRAHLKQGKTSELKMACMHTLRANGKYISIDDGALLLRSDRLHRITELVELGVIKPVNDRVYPF